MSPAESKVVKKILSANDEIAGQNRLDLTENRVLGVNIMASPGAGKTSLIMATIEALRGRMRVGVIEGDVASSVDAERVATAGVPVVQINTGGGCHLEARMVREAMHNLPLGELDLLFIENIGNLICPTSWLLGEGLRIAIASVPEGDDKPLKYPDIFTQVDAVVLTKTDLLPYVRFDLSAFRERVAGLNRGARSFELSCVSGEGVDVWASWLVECHASAFPTSAAG